MTLLDDLQVKLSRAGATRVIGAYESGKLLHPGDDIRIFIPDLHLLTAQARAFNGKHGPTPSHALLQSVLAELVEFRAQVKSANPGAVCAVYFMGDTLDLWREGRPGSDVATLVQRIADEHHPLLALACGTGLKARFLLGNHDFELFRAASFRAADRRYFFPALSPGTVALHGDVFDWIEDFPDLFNEAVVYYLGSTYNHLDHIREQLAACMRVDRDDAPPPAPAASVVSRCGTLDQAESCHRLFRRARQACAKMNGEYSMGLRCIVIGHTHSPRIVEYESPNEFFVLVDVGGWIQDARDTVGQAESGTIGAMCGNEVRIFEVSTG